MHLANGIGFVAPAQTVGFRQQASAHPTRIDRLTHLLPSSNVRGGYSLPDRQSGRLFSDVIGNSSLRTPYAASVKSRLVLSAIRSDSSSSSDQDDKNILKTAENSGGLEESAEENLNNQNGVEHDTDLQSPDSLDGMGEIDETSGEKRKNPELNPRYLLPLPKDVHMPKAVPETLHRIGDEVSKIGDKVGHMLSRTSDGNEMKLEIVDRLHDCYPSCPVGLTKYKVDHNDFSGQRTLRIDTEFVEDDASLYHRLMRDTVYAQWMEKDDATLELHIQMHLTQNSEGAGPEWEHWLRDKSNLPEHIVDEIVSIGGEMRKQIFEAHVEDAIEVIFTSVRELLKAKPELNKAPVRIQYLSSLESLNEDNESGTVGSWMEKIDTKVEDGKRKALCDAIQKNLEIWSGAAKSSKKALDRFAAMVASECRAGSLRRLMDDIQANGGIEIVVLAVMIAVDKLSKR